MDTGIIACVVGIIITICMVTVPIVIAVRAYKKRNAFLKKFEDKFLGDEDNKKYDDVMRNYQMMLDELDYKLHHNQISKQQFDEHKRLIQENMRIFQEQQLRV